MALPFQNIVREGHFIGFWGGLNYPQDRGTRPLIAEGDPTLGPELFDVPEAEAEAMIKPDGIGNDLRGKAVATIWGRLCAHRD